MGDIQKLMATLGILSLWPSNGLLNGRPPVVGEISLAEAGIHGAVYSAQVMGFFSGREFKFHITSTGAVFSNELREYLHHIENGGLNMSERAGVSILEQWLGHNVSKVGSPLDVWAATLATVHFLVTEMKKRGEEVMFASIKVNMENFCAAYAVRDEIIKHAFNVVIKNFSSK